MRLIKLLILMLFFICCGAVYADKIALNPDYPERYIVVKGDTLWDISAKFLTDPWRWPDVWEFNPQIKNPHLIYPGDVIELVFKDGKPVLQVSRGGEKKPANVKLAPQVHRANVGRAIPTIPMEHIQQFLTQSIVISEEELDNSAYIVSSLGKHLVIGSGDQVYVRRVASNSINRYAIYRTGVTYRNLGARPDQILGYEAIYVGKARVKRYGDPSIMKISESRREALIGDRILPIEENELNQHFIPHAPKNPVDGRIIWVVDGVSRIGIYQTVVVNLGESDGVEPGHVLAVYTAGETIRDTVSVDPRDKIALPDSRSGLAMIYRSFNRVSYALIMQSIRDMRKYDIVRNP